MKREERKTEQTKAQQIIAKNKEIERLRNQISQLNTKIKTLSI